MVISRGWRLGAVSSTRDGWRSVPCPGASFPQEPGRTVTPVFSQRAGMPGPVGQDPLDRHRVEQPQLARDAPAMRSSIGIIRTATWPRGVGLQDVTAVQVG